jgi:hypothetical protein
VRASGNQLLRNVEGDEEARKLDVNQQEDFVDFSAQPDEVVRGDFDGDDAIDAAAAITIDNSVEIALNDGEGGLEVLDGVPSIAGEVNADASLVDIAAADLDGSGSDDIAALFDSNQAVLVTGIDSEGASGSVLEFQPRGDEAVYDHIDLGSIDRSESDEGTADIAVAAEEETPFDGPRVSAEVGVYENQGDGTSFDSYFRMKTNRTVQTVLFEDITFNGFADILVGDLFWQHNPNEESYRNCEEVIGESCRRRLEWEDASKATEYARARFTDDEAPELVAMHGTENDLVFSFTVLRPHCP